MHACGDCNGQCFKEALFILCTPATHHGGSSRHEAAAPSSCCKMRSCLDAILAYLHPIMQEVQAIKGGQASEGFAALAKLRSFVGRYRRKRALLSRFGQKQVTKTVALEFLRSMCMGLDNAAYSGLPTFGLDPACVMTGICDILKESIDAVVSASTFRKFMAMFGASIDFTLGQCHREQSISLGVISQNRPPAHLELVSELTKMMGCSVLVNYTAANEAMRTQALPVSVGSETSPARNMMLRAL